MKDETKTLTIISVCMLLSVAVMSGVMIGLISNDAVTPSDQSSAQSIISSEQITSSESLSSVTTSSDAVSSEVVSSDSVSGEATSSKDTSSKVTSSNHISSSVSSSSVSNKPAISTPTVDKNNPYYDVIMAVNGLDGKRHGFGFGLEVNKQNQPLLALEQQKKYGKYGMTAITDNMDTIYLTLDEGYEAGYTPKILDVLKEKDCKATFFVTMSYVKSNPTLVKRMINEGHVVGNHSVNHPVMPTISVEKMITEIMDLHYYVLEHFGYEMKLFRPPTGAYSEVSLEVARLLGYRTLEWSFAYEDWDEDKQPNKKTAFDYITEKTHGGAVYLLHAVSKTNAEIIGDVIDYWRQTGYEVSPFPNISPNQDIPKPEKEDTTGSDMSSGNGSTESTDNSSCTFSDNDSSETDQTVASTPAENDDV